MSPRIKSSVVMRAGRFLIRWATKIFPLQIEHSVVCLHPVLVDS
jgi:hypothetical protein